MTTHQTRGEAVHRPSKWVSVRSNATISDLPFEICCLISASLSSKDIRHVTLVCRGTRNLFIPILYRIVKAGRSLSALHTLCEIPRLGAVVRELHVTHEPPRLVFGSAAFLDAVQQQKASNVRATRKALQILGEDTSSLLLLDWDSDFLADELGHVLTERQRFRALIQLSVHFRSDSSDHDYEFFSIPTLKSLSFRQKLGHRKFIASQQRISKALGQIGANSVLHTLNFIVETTDRPAEAANEQSFFRAYNELISSFTLLRLPCLRTLAFNMESGNRDDFDGFLAAHPELTSLEFDFEDTTLQAASLSVLDTYIGSLKGLTTVLDGKRPVRCVKIRPWTAQDFGPSLSTTRAWKYAVERQHVLANMKKTLSLQSLSIFPTPSSYFVQNLVSNEYGQSDLCNSQVEEIALACPNLTYFEFCIVAERSRLDELFSILARLLDLIHIVLHIDQYSESWRPVQPDNLILPIVHFIEKHMDAVMGLTQVTMHIQVFEHRSIYQAKCKEEMYILGVTRKGGELKVQSTGGVSSGLPRSVGGLR